MKTNWKAMAASLAVLIGVSGAAYGQDFDHRKDDDKRIHVENHDRDHDRKWDKDHDRRVYNNNWYRDHDHDYRGPVYRGPVYSGPVYRGPVTPYYGGSNGYYGGGGYRGGNARQVGYQDGLNDGRHDRMTGHSFRPTQDDNYKNADRGYSSAFGDKQAYKDTYRVGYEQGYQQGYGR
ncbi:MAG TPA: hypothetical protein VG897_10880 [Terriglobales bacterium]|nr:hypothetical protein [Terriglobales bacterium]